MVIKLRKCNNDFNEHFGEPVGASILAFFFLGEKLNAMQIIGSMLVLFGVSVFLLQQRKRTAKNVVNEPAYTQEL